ncbi:MAG: cyclic nucleotide-binding protein [Deltaproteobacteria bacterium CG17_big_fil_post_rev_8_21_14_2_50_51_6]|nr:MAG: cyclic nucleotide-binding protein [Deltaproteobacteria bacterium CG17_big_fil_post_rev_8_21_14_2_50_51_6]
MTRFMARWLKIYEDEIAVFFWTTLLYFLIRIAAILLNNFAETAFLKRYGVEYLPVVYMINAVSTFFVMGFITGLMAKIPGSKLLSGMLLFTGVSVASFRFIITLDFDIIYPVLWILKAQYEVLLGLVFWNLANDLFNTRQSKRIFPIITAGGVIGAIFASFATPLIVRLVSIDNVMFLYLIVSIAAAATVYNMGGRFPTLLLREERAKKAKGRSTIIDEFRKVIPMMKESLLIKILIALSLIPNIVIPIINYQFNFAADQAFATEGGMIKFFGFFRGSMNFVSLIILLFVGRIYARWGLPVALMFHPCNYVIAFFGYLFNFSIITAVYAQISTTVIRNTINNPARAVLVGLIPSAYRAVIRPFLRGTVVRIGTLSGSGIILLMGSYFHPRYLSIVAIFMMGWWLYTNLVLRKNYPKILLDLVSKNVIDLRSMEDKDVSQIFADRKMRAQLRASLAQARGDNFLWYARIMRSMGIEDLDGDILSAIRAQDEKTQIALLDMVSPAAGKAALNVFKSITDKGSLELTAAVLKAGYRISPDIFAQFSREVFQRSDSPRVKAYALGNLYSSDPGAYRPLIENWLHSDSKELWEAGIIAAGRSGDPGFLNVLHEFLRKDIPSSILPILLRALGRLDAPDLPEVFSSFLSHGDEEVRIAALESMEIKGDSALRSVIALMRDPSEKVSELARDRLMTSTYQNPQILVEALASPSREIREGVFDILEKLNIGSLDVYRFARLNLEKAYISAAEAWSAAKILPEGKERDILLEHLKQERRLYVETVLRVLAAEDRTGQMRIIWRGIASQDSRQRSNALEALEDSMDKALAKVLIPLAEEIPDSEIISIGKKNFRLPAFNRDPVRLVKHLLEEKNRVTVLLTIYAAGRMPLGGSLAALIGERSLSGDPQLRLLVEKTFSAHGSRKDSKEADMEEMLTVPDKIILLRGIHIFEGLTINELAAIASVTEEMTVPAGEPVIREGDTGDSMYLVINGEVAVTKTKEDGGELELDRIKSGDYFGEMALFDEEPRSATVRPVTGSRFLVLYKREFTESVREYPQIALQICRALSRRMRNLQAKIKQYEKCS